MTLLAARDVSMHYTTWRGFFGFFRPGRKTALENVSLSLAPGEVVGLSGPNASGKTTLLKVLAGLLLPARGAVTLDGQDLAGLGPAARRHVSIAIADSRSFYWRLTCRQNLEFFAALWCFDGAERTRRIAQAADLTGVAACLPEPFMNLSSGMMQRMALARSFLADARVRLFDEPTRDLDEETRSRFRHLLRSLAADGTAVLLVSHDRNELRSTCQRVISLREGRVVADVPAAHFPASGTQEAP